MYGQKGYFLEEHMRLGASMPCKSLKGVEKFLLGCSIGDQSQEIGPRKLGAIRFK